MPYNPNNPYILNPLYFSNVTNIKYSDNRISTFHTLNNWILFIFGLFTTLLLIYLVLTKTPQIFKVYSRLILICAIIDLCYILINFLTQYRFKSSDYLLVDLEGPLNKLSYSIQCHTFCVYTLIQLSTFLILPYEYGYRYFTIKNKASPSLIKVLFYFIICIIVLIIGYYTVYVAYCSLKSNAGKQEFAKEWYSEVLLPKIFIDQDPLTLFNGYSFNFVFFWLSNYICYGTAVFFAIMTQIALKKSSAELQLIQKTLILQKQFGYSLLIQLLVPLIYIIPMAFGNISTPVDIDSQLSDEILTGLVNYHPILNTLSNLVFIAPYRRYCLEKLSKKSVNNNSVRVTPANPS